MKMFAKLVVSLAVVVCLSGTAVVGDNSNDPAEGWNRAMFSVNEGFDMVIVKPLVQGYDYVVLLPVRAVVGNFFSNVGDLVIGLNNFL